MGPCWPAKVPFHEQQHGSLRRQSRRRAGPIATGAGTGAMRGYAREIGAISAFRLESCIHCGNLRRRLPLLHRNRGSAIHADLESGALQNRPTSARPARFAPLFRLLGLKREVTADQLEQWQHLLFDSCNMCGRLQPDLSHGHRRGRAHRAGAPRDVSRPGLAPKELYEKAGAPAGDGPAGGER